MFAGHTAFALLARRARPTIPFALLFVAAYFPDFVEIGLRETKAPVDPLVWSHSLLAVGAQALVIMLVVLAIWRDARGAGIGALAVISHWPADFITGSGKPTWPGGPEVGLFLYDHHLADFLLETALLLGAWWVARMAFPRMKRLWGHVGMAALVALQGAYALRVDDGSTPPAGKGDILRTVTNAIHRLGPSEGRGAPRH